MDELHAQYVIAVGDLCAVAMLASFEVGIRTRDGGRMRGVPRSVRSATGGDEVDDSGYARTFAIDDSLVGLDDVVECTVHAPATALD